MNTELLRFWKKIAIDLNHMNTMLSTILTENTKKLETSNKKNQNLIPKNNDIPLGSEWQCP
jgi:hypothetical protein